MAEMHLDLCIQSTSHLLETVSNIKENIRILEVFMNSGMQSVDYNKPIGFINDDYAGSDRGSIGTGTESNSRYYQYNDTTAIGRRHLNCCCMCHFRVPECDKKNNRNGNGTYLEGQGVPSGSNKTLTSNGTHKKLSASPTPRLNRTASLRRETIMQRVSRKNSSY